MRQFDEIVAGLQLLHLQNILHSGYIAETQPGLLPGLEDVHLAIIQQPGQHQRVHLVGILQPPAPRGKARVGQFLPLHNAGHFRPAVVGAGDDAHIAVGAGVDAPGGPPIAPVADAGIFLAGIAVLHYGIFQDVGGVFGDGQVNLLAEAGFFGIHQRG